MFAFAGVLAESVTVNVWLMLVSSTVGVPLIIPAASILNPAGKGGVTVVDHV